MISGNRADTSFPSVMDAIVLRIASFLRTPPTSASPLPPPRTPESHLSCEYCEFSPFRSSKVSPFRGAVGNMLRILLAAMVLVDGLVVGEGCLGRAAKLELAGLALAYSKITCIHLLLTLREHPVSIARKWKWYVLAPFEHYSLGLHLIVARGEV